MSPVGRLALITPVFPQLSETFIAAKAAGLAERGWDVHVVCGTSDEPMWAAFGADHPVQRLRSRVHVAPELARHWSAAPAGIQRLGRLRHAPRSAIGGYLADRTTSLPHRLTGLIGDADLVALAPDVVHFEFGSLAPGRLALRTRLGCAVTVSFRGYDLNYVGLDQPGFYDAVWAEADRIHLLGHDLWQRAIHRGAPADLAHTLISPAIDTSDVHPAIARSGALGTSAQPLRLVSIGRLHWKKGYEHALEAVAQLRRRGIEVEHRIVGDGGLLEAVAFWRHQLGLDEHVELLGAVPPGEVAEHLRWADVLLHAATSEGFGNAVIEAQAHGVPVVCTDADGLGENVEDHVTGLVVPRRDPKALANALERVATDADLRLRLAAAGPPRVDERFRLDQQLDAWEQFYVDALATRRAARR